jgi:hypothetical protein
MPTLKRLWAGRVFGTNTGNLFLEFDSTDDDKISGTIRFMDSTFGLTVYRVAGSFDGKLLLKGEPAQTPEGADAGLLEITGVLTPEGNLRGGWRSSIGTAGTFEAYPHDVPDRRADDGVQVPEQIYTSTRTLGALRLYANDFDKLTQFIKEDFIIGRMVVTYSVRNNEVTKYLEDFQKEVPTLGQLRRIKLSIQEPEAHGINKVVVLELNWLGQNEIRVQGINELWVVGKAEAIASILRTFERGLVTTYRKFGLTLNQAIYLAMLILIPAIASLWQRTLFVGVVVLLLAALFQLHSHFIPNATLYFGEKEPTTFQRVWPSLLSWLSAVTASLAAALVFYWLTRK